MDPRTELSFFASCQRQANYFIVRLLEAHILLKEEQVFHKSWELRRGISSEDLVKASKRLSI
jgi:hypothetical protein